MVSEDGQEFYRELTDGWKLIECTMFVISWVLPLLSEGKVGNKLYMNLEKHLDLIQFECDADNLFPKNKIIVAAHLLPTLLSYLFLIPFFLLSAEEKIKLIENHGKGYGAYNTLTSFAIRFSGIFYVIWSSLLLKKHKKNILDQFSDIEEINLKWLQLLIVGIGIIWSIVIFSNNGEYIFTGVAIFVILIGFFGIQQKAIFNSEVIIVKNTNDISVLGGIFL